MADVETMRDNVVDLISKLARSPRNEALPDTAVRAKAVARLLGALARYDEVHEDDEWDDDDEDDDEDDDDDDD